MGSPASDLFTIQDIPDAGRGVIATRPIEADTLVLTAPCPAVHVIFRQYRKEVCAQCFHYDRGRTLKVRDNSIGKVFCSIQCQQEWIVEQGDAGIEAWRALQTYVTSKAKAVSDASNQITVDQKPDQESIGRAWKQAAEFAQRVRRNNIQHESNGHADDHGNRKGSHQTWSQHINPDVLGYILSGVLFNQQHPQEWQNEVIVLATDPTPYSTISDLESHCNSFVQLATILPDDVLPSLEPDLCRTLAEVSSHNAFGIRSGGEDREEYMGYSLYPSASYFNHSCEPNIGKQQIGRQWLFKASRPVSKNEQLCISYLGGDEKDLSITERRSRLKSQWGFECMCQRCVREDGS